MHLKKHSSKTRVTQLFRIVKLLLLKVLLPRHAWQKQVSRSIFLLFLVKMSTFQQPATSPQMCLSPVFCRSVTGQFSKSRHHRLQWGSVRNPGPWLVDNTGPGPFTKFLQHLLHCGSDRIPHDHLQASLENPGAWLVNNNTGSWLGDSWINTAWFSA